MVWAPHVTVASIVERDARYLCVLEEADGARVHNQPAGHLEPGEGLVDAAVRETREETGLRLHPQALVGVYRWAHPRSGETFLRFTFCGAVEAGEPEPQDPDICAAQWLSRAELAAAPLRSPLVLRSIDDYLAGHRYPLSLLAELG
jgi:ADP-ribose pyrophosphatase YjhB (NUDIX family)